MKQSLRHTVILAIATTGVLALAAQPVFSQDAMAQKVATRFAAADTNHDDKLTLAEAQAGMPRIAQTFDQIDVDHAGYITLAQITAFAASHKR